MAWQLNRATILVLCLVGVSGCTSQSRKYYPVPASIRPKIEALLNKVGVHKAVELRYVNHDVVPRQTSAIGNEKISWKTASGSQVYIAITRTTWFFQFDRGVAAPLFKMSIPESEKQLAVASIFEGIVPGHPKRVDSLPLNLSPDVDRYRVFNDVGNVVSDVDVDSKTGQVKRIILFDQYRK